MFNRDSIPFHRDSIPVHRERCQRHQILIDKRKPEINTTPAGVEYSNCEHICYKCLNPMGSVVGNSWIKFESKRLY